MEGLLTIGEFAEATRLSPKALRLYAERGLLSPTRLGLPELRGMRLRYRVVSVPVF